MKKVAIIDTLGAHGGGFHFYTFGQSMGLINHGFDVSLYTNNETPNPKINKLNFFTFYKNIFKSKLKIINGFRWIIGSLLSIFHARMNGVSMFHFHIFYSNSLILFNLFLVKLLFGKVILTIHDVSSLSDNEESSMSYKLMYKLTDLILTHNKFSKKEIIKKNYTLTQKIHIVPHGNYTPFIDIKQDKLKSKQYLGIPENKKIILFFGMIKEAKGLDILLKAFRKVVDLNSNIILLIAGKTWKDDHSFYQNLIDKNNLANNIFFHNHFIEDNDVGHYYCVSDIVVLPYKRIYQSGVLMMALSYARPVLVSDLDPFNEILSDNKNGFFFKSEDVNDLAKKLCLLLTDNENLLRVQQNGRRLVNQRFDWIQIGRLVKEAYQTL